MCIRDRKVFILAVAFYGRADGLDKIVGKLIGHIQTEPAGPKGEPGVDDAALAADEPAVTLSLIHI